MARAACSDSPFRYDLAHQSNLLRLGRVETSARQQQVANDRIPQIALQTRNSAETGNQSQPQFGKTKAGHLVGDDQIAYQRELKPSAKGHAMDRRNGGQRRRIDPFKTR